MLFSIEFLASVFEENNLERVQPMEFKQVSTDSRESMDDGLFIPLKGESFDAHDFLLSAVKQGAIAALWEKDHPIPESLEQEFPLFFVKDTQEALHHLAKQYLNQIKPVVIGVTGSNGKTTTKDLVGAVAASKYKTHRTAGNFNNHIGLPLTILSMPRNTEVLVLEMGMSQFGEIEVLSRLAEPDYAVITNIGESHIEHLGSREGIAKAKMEIMAGMDETGIVIYDGDEPLLTKLKTKGKSISCGFGLENAMVAKDVNMHKGFTTFSVNEDGKFKLGMLGRHNVKNACFAIAIGRELDIPEDKIKKSLEKVELTGMRFEMIEGKNGVTIVNDAYNASPTSMKASIEVVREMDSYQKKILVLGDIFELGKDAKALHKSVAEAVTPEIKALFTIGSSADEITKEVQIKEPGIEAIHFEDFSALVSHLQSYLDKNSLILLKASRGMKLERIITDLQ